MVPHLLVNLLLISCLEVGDGIMIENVQKFITDENVTRPEVRIPQGTVLGVNMMSHHTRLFFGFKGIPFAQPPVGNLRFAIRQTNCSDSSDTNIDSYPAKLFSLFRFKGPLPANSWNGILDGSKNSNQCPQLVGKKFVGDEDCLHLNIYTPQLSAVKNSTNSALLPVMIFVYGGKFKTGTINPTRWGPQFILDKDVVLVVPNYRMGVLGYLSTGDEVSPGNYGLKDLVQALKWIQDNIRYFDGDPNQVTISGGSSGAIAVHLLTLSNLTNGLFHRFITQSGSALDFRLSRKTLLNSAIRLGIHLGCPTNASTSLVNCLRDFNASQLVDTNSIFLEWYEFPHVIWGPTVELDMEGAFLTDTPANLIAAGKIRDLPWLCSVTRNEGIISAVWLYEKPNVFQKVLDNIDSVLPIMLQYDKSVKNITAYTTALKSYYLNDLSANRSLLLTNLTQLMGDSTFTYPTHSGMKRQLVHAKNPQYLCSFEYRGTASYSYYFSGGSTKNWGAAHADELLYLLPGPNSQFGPPGSNMSETDLGMVETMVQLWTSFAINGIPSTVDPNGTVIWEPYSSRDNYLQIGNGPDPALEVKYGLHVDRMRFWEELYAAPKWI